MFAWYYLIPLPLSRWNRQSMHATERRRMKRGGRGEPLSMSDEREEGNLEPDKKSKGAIGPLPIYTFLRRKEQAR
jgi:hypothetical protein